MVNHTGITSVCVGEASYNVDKNGFIHVSPLHVRQLKEHGFSVVAHKFMAPEADLSTLDAQLKEKEALKKLEEEAKREHQEELKKQEEERVLKEINDEEIMKKKRK